MSDIKRKHALCFAHRGEAKAFIKRWKLKGSSDQKLSGVWGSSSTAPEIHPHVWVLGEGIELAGIRLAYLLGKFQEVDTVLNLGVAASLRAGIIPKGRRLNQAKHPKIGEIVQIRTSYGMHYDQKTRFKSYTSKVIPLGIPSLDCISIGTRLRTPEEGQYVSAFAPVLDMELWGLHLAAKTSACDLYSIKVISDLVESDGAISDSLCERVRSKSDQFSEALYRGWEKWNQYFSVDATKAMQVPTDFFDRLNDRFPDAFWLSTYQKNELSKNMRALAISQSLSDNELAMSLLNHSKLKEIVGIKGPAKRRGALLSSEVKSLVFQASSLEDISERPADVS